MTLFEEQFLPRTFILILSYFYEICYKTNKKNVISYQSLIPLPREDRLSWLGSYRTVAK